LILLPNINLEEADINLDAFERIVADHFRAAICHRFLMNGGSYARVFLFTLENNFQAVGRVVLPIREVVKTEAEVAAMEMVRCKPLLQCGPDMIHSDQYSSH
jgi:hypothetical protein